MSLERNLPRLLGAGALLAVVIVTAFAVRSAAVLPDGPFDVVWDKTACAHCSMHIGEPAFAAQVIGGDGEELAFDDPGCLFAWLDAGHPAPHRIWFHHLRDDRWLDADVAAFVAVTPTPMGFGWGAVEAGTPDAVDFPTARARCARRADGSEGGR